MKKGVVIQYHKEILNWKVQGSVLFDFHNIQIAAFYERHKADVELIETEIRQLQEEFFYINDNKIQQNAANTAMYKPGKTEADFEEAVEKLMNQDTPPFAVRKDVKVLSKNPKKKNEKRG